jgi:hypothetical protein
MPSVKHAPLPSDVKWNARNKISRNERLKTACTYLGIVAVLFLSIAIITWIRYQSQMLVTPFKQIRCRKFFPTFGDKLADYSE